MIRHLCQHPCCSRFRVEGSKYCERHREKDEARDKAKEEERTQKRDYTKLKEDPVSALKLKYYSSTRWHKESSEFIKRKGCCEICGRSDLRLQVHHNYPNSNYFNDYDFWDKNNWLVVCASCHAKLTKEQSKKNYRFDFRS